mmetsp:Transcript_51744/g.70550  ORF Transcript_51744/g.70550 Transcript_51744/m.70550 type:complete len:402 (+) Transcript_51744:48-1253(+)
MYRGSSSLASSAEMKKGQDQEKPVTHGMDDIDDEAKTKLDSHGEPTKLTYDLVWIKLLYFGNTLRDVGWGRFQGVYLNSVGMTPAQNGLARFAGLFAKTFCGPIWGLQADRCGNPVGLMMLSVVLTGLFMELYRAPVVIGSFAALLLVKFIRSGANCGGTLLDLIAMATIEDRAGAGYGAQRIAGSVAWGFGSYLVGHLIDRYGWSAMFSVTYLCSGGVLVLLAAAPKHLHRKVSSGGGRRSTLEVFRGYGKFLNDPSARIFLGLVLLYGVAMALPEQIMFLQMEREFETPKASMGKITLIGTLTEYPAFLLSNQLIARFGHQQLLMVAHVTMALRLALMSTVTKATQGRFAVIQGLHGICFGFAWPTIVDYSYRSAPKSLKATAQGVVSTAYYVVGAGFG